MPAEARGHARRLASGKWQLRYYDRDGQRQSGGVFATRTEALRPLPRRDRTGVHGRPAARRDLTLQELADLFLERHGTVASPAPSRTLRERLTRPAETSGRSGGRPRTDDRRDRQGSPAGCPSVTATRRVRASPDARGGVRYGYMTRNPAKLAGKNPQPAPRGDARVHPGRDRQDHGELDERGAAAVRFAAATGLRPAEWASIERRDVDRARRVLSVRGTKTLRSRREVPLTTAALAALDRSRPARLPLRVRGDSREGPFDFDNFGRRDWRNAIDTGRDREARPDLRPPLDVRLERARGRGHGRTSSAGSWARPWG